MRSLRTPCLTGYSGLCDVNLSCIIITYSRSFAFLLKTYQVKHFEIHVCTITTLQLCNIFCNYFKYDSQESALKKDILTLIRPCNQNHVYFTNQLFVSHICRPRILVNKSRRTRFPLPYIVLCFCKDLENMENQLFWKKRN